MTDQDHRDPDYVLGAVLAQLEDLDRPTQIKVLNEALVDLADPQRLLDRALADYVIAQAEAGTFLQATPTETYTAILRAFHVALGKACHGDLTGPCTFEDGRCIECGRPRTVQEYRCAQEQLGYPACSVCGRDGIPMAQDPSHGHLLCERCEEEARTGRSDS
jgi:hypothetical protein